MSLCLSQNSHSRTPVLGISVIFPKIGQGFGPGGNGYGFFFLSRITILTAAYATIARIRLLTISVLKNMVLAVVGRDLVSRPPESSPGYFLSMRGGRGV